MNNTGTSTLKIGVIGYGYWGPNVVRNFYNVSDAAVVSVADVSQKSLDRVRAVYPSMELTTNAERYPDEPWHRRRCDCHSHFASPCSGKKGPGKREARFCREAFHRQRRRGRGTDRTCRAQEPEDHGGSYVSLQGAVRKIRELIDNGTLGKLYYYDSTRVNLGIFQHDSNVVWDLAPHDLSIIDYLIPTLRPPWLLRGKSTSMEKKTWLSSPCTFQEK